MTPTRTLTFAALATASLTGAAMAGQPSNCTYSGQSIFAGCKLPTGGAAATDETAVYGGVQIAFGAAKPETRLVLGIRSLHVSTDNASYGADLALRFAVKDGISFDSSVISLVGGKGDALANVGIGYSYAAQSWMGTVALQADHLRAGADYVFTLSQPTWFIEANTLEKPAPAGGALGCPQGYALVRVGGPNNSYDSADPDVIRDGRTCAVPPG